MVIALVVGALVGYYVTALANGTGTATMTVDQDSISLLDGVSLCSSNCVYPSPFLSATVLVNASSSPILDLRLVLNGTDEGIVTSFSNSTVTHFAYQLKTSPRNAFLPVYRGLTHSVLFIATFRNGDSSTASAFAVAG